MKQVILISDPHGFPLRGVAPATAAETAMICPHDKPQPHARSVEFPETWLPTQQDLPYGKRCWWVCDRIFPAAVQQLGIEADFYWCVESDVCAAADTWQQLIAESGKRTLDGIHVHLSTREMNPNNGWFKHPSTPGWATRHSLGAMYRFSRRAMDWLAQTAEANREVFCEVNAPSVIHREGGSTGDLKNLGWFYNGQCMQANPKRLGMNTLLFNHPLKINTSEPVIVR